jgi:hypothetical protein
MSSTVFLQNVPTNKTPEQKKISRIAKRTPSYRAAMTKPSPVKVYTPAAYGQLS